MTIGECRERLGEIADVATDPERAHSLQDKLWEDVLEAMARGDCFNSKTLAQEALQAREIEFPRWCA